MNTKKLANKKFYFECSGHHMGNKGDVAMLKCFLKLLERNWPKSTYYIPIADYKINDFENLNIQAVVTIEDFILGKTINVELTDARKKMGRLANNFLKVIRLFYVFLKLIIIKFNLNEPQNKTDVAFTLYTIKKSDAVFITGGGYINDVWSVHSAIRCGLIPLLSFFLGKPVIFTGHGIGPMRKKWLQLWFRFCFGKVCFFSLREGLKSPEILQKLKVPKDKIVVSGDDAFNLQCKEKSDEMRKQLGISERKAIVGLNIRLHGYNVNAQDYIDDVINITKQVALKLDATVLYICTDFTPGTKNDVFSAQLAKKLFGENVDFIYLDKEIDPESIKSLTALCNIVVAHSYHVLVFALSMGIPSVGFYNCDYYRDKLLGLLDFVGMPEYAIDLKNANIEEIIEKLTVLPQNEFIKEILKNSIAKWSKLQLEWEKKVVSLVEKCEA